MIIAGLMLSYVIHIFALYYGLRSWKLGEKGFSRSDISKVFVSRVEQKFITICVGCTANILFLFLVPVHVFLFGVLHDIMGVGFACFHITSGIATAMWHYITYNDIKKGGLCED